MKIKIQNIFILILLILNIFNGCMQHELDENSEGFNQNFKINNLQILPNITIPGQLIIISIDVENLNKIVINNSVSLDYNNGMNSSKYFQLEPFGTKTIKWEISEYSIGVYTISIGNLKGSYTISDEIAWFELSDLVIQSDKIELNETTNISVIVENNGYVPDHCILDLYVNDKIEQTKKVMIDDGEKKNISFKFKKSDFGIYNIRINDLKGKIQVEKFEDISNIEIIEFNVTARKIVKEGCCYKYIIINDGFNYSSEIEYFFINGTVINKNNYSIKTLKIIGNFYDIDDNKLFSRETYVTNLAYLTTKKFLIAVKDAYSIINEFKRIDYIKFEFSILE